MVLQLLEDFSSGRYL